MKALLKISAICPTLIIAAIGAGLNADEGRIPIFEQTIITQPGKYVVTRNFTSTGVPITIQSNDVSIDLNGHTVTAPASCSVATRLPSVIVVDTSSATRGIAIRNGRLAQGCSGILGTSTSPLTITVSQLEIMDSQQTGVSVRNAQAVDIFHCNIHDAGSGISASQSTGVFRGHIVENTLTGLDGSGIVLGGISSGEVLHNVIGDYGSVEIGAYGIALYGSAVEAPGGNLVAENSVSGYPSAGPSDGGILVTSPHNFLLNNVVVRNGSYGINVQSDENRLENNIASQNGSHGIRIGLPTGAGFRNHLEGNQVQGNIGAGSCGIMFENGNSHSYRNNIGGNNSSSGAACIPPGNDDLGGNLGL